MDSTIKNELYQRLTESYSEKNLTRLSTILIQSYKSKKYAYLHQLNTTFFEENINSEDKISKIFSKLIMLFHPDKCKAYQNEIEECIHENNESRLLVLAKIFRIENIDETSSQAPFIDSDFAFEAEYVWDFDESGFSYFTEDEERLVDLEPIQDELFEERTSFISALKRREYGTIKIDFPVHQLYDFEEIELADYEIEDLEGIEFCQHLLSLDLSNNLLSDISKISKLKLLEELYLSNNSIYVIDRLISLKNLKVLDIANNNIEDISVLLRLNDLEYLNIIGNRIPSYQIEKLKETGVIVIH